MIQKYGALLLSISLLCGCTASESDEIAAISETTLQEIRDDMNLEHEALPHGIPETYNWKYKPRLGYGNQCPNDWNAFIAWGQVYVDETQANDEDPAPNTRVQLKDMRALVLNKKGKWSVLQNATTIVGSNYAEDFVDDANKPADIRNEGNGSISIRAGQGYNFHFFPDSRVNIDPKSIRAIVVMASARLITDNPALEEDRGQSKYIMSVGADYWRSLSAQWSADWSNNGDVGIGRFKRVTNEWKTFYMHSISYPDITECPIPASLME